MAEWRSAPTYDPDESDDSVDVSEWTNAEGSHKKRCRIIREIIKNKDLVKLGTILESGWDVNEMLNLHSPSYIYKYNQIDLLSYVIINNCSDKVYISKIVQLLLEHRANPNVTHEANKAGPEGTKLVHRTALHEAVAVQDTDVVKMLLDAGAKCAASPVLQNPLALALQYCPPDFIKLLLELGMDPNDHDDQRENIPLLQAIYNCEERSQYYIPIVQLLLEHKADPNVAHKVNLGTSREPKWVQRTALHEALQEGVTDVVKMLLEAGAKCKGLNPSQNPLLFALKWHPCNPDSSSDLVKLLVEHGADPNDHDGENIPLLSGIGYSENTIIIVQLLLAAGAKCNVSSCSSNPLSVALRHGHCLPDLFELLLKHGADPNDHTSDLDIPLRMAINFSKNLHGLRIVQLLLDHGANPNVTYEVDIGSYKEVKLVQTTPLCEAVRRGWTEGVEMLLNNGAKCKGLNVSQNPIVLALHMAKHPDSVVDLTLLKLLLKHGADPNDHDGQCENIPLLVAKDFPIWHRKKGTVILQLLLDHGANPDVTYRVDIGRCREWVNRTVLQFAALRGWTEWVKMFLDAGAKCKELDASQNPLALALQNPDCPPDLVKLLLEHGMDPNDHDGQAGNIPLLCAIRIPMYPQRNTVIFQQLLDHKANPNVTYRVNIGTFPEDKWVHRTALYEAVSEEWTEGVRMLLEAGARCTTSDTLETPLVLAQQDDDCPLDLKQNNTVITPLLSEHGANRNVTHKVNIERYGEEKSVQRTPLGEAVHRRWTEGVEMLLNNGAKCKGLNALENPLALALQIDDCPLDVIILLVRHGADVNCTVVGVEPLLHRLLQCTIQGDCMFPQQHLDLFFQHGGNINMENGEYGTALEHVVMEGGHSNSVRWLIRHGAPIVFLKYWFTIFARQFQQYSGGHLHETSLILLQAGMRVPCGAQTLISDTEVATTSWLQEVIQGTRQNYESKTLQDIWDQLEEAECSEYQRMQSTFRKSTFHEYLTQQWADLQEFSDQSLHIYPEVTPIKHTHDSREEGQNILDQSHRLLQFLSQTHSLQWHCRCCVRENLVSLQPSVVKTLRIPARLKRYVLCHEI